MTRSTFKPIGRNAIPTANGVTTLFLPPCCITGGFYPCGGKFSDFRADNMSVISNFRFQQTAAILSGAGGNFTRQNQTKRKRTQTQRWQTKSMANRSGPYLSLRSACTFRCSGPGGGFVIPADRQHRSLLAIHDTVTLF